jgi:hypothetical protein
MEAASTSEPSVNFYQTTPGNIPEDSHPHTRRRENLKSNQDRDSTKEETKARLLLENNKVEQAEEGNKREQGHQEGEENSKEERKRGEE